MIMNYLWMGERIPWIRWIARLSAGDVLYLQRCVCSAAARGGEVTAAALWLQFCQNFPKRDIRT
jgi:hypothetical protein